MSPHESDTTLVARLKSAPDRETTQALWHRYFDRLAGLARKRLGERTRRAADEEDVALSAFDSFFRGVATGRFPRLDDRDDLWQVLVLLTERKAIDRVRRETADKRGGGEVRGDSAFCGPDDSALVLGPDQVAGPEPTPEFAAMFAEECEYLLARLGDPELVRVALFKLEGFTNDEIGAKLGRVGRSIQRKLETIRAIWEQISEQQT
jgi:DNA-directed RNA polymerase specialized sigma24 family protein